LLIKNTEMVSKIIVSTLLLLLFLDTEAQFFAKQEHIPLFVAGFHSNGHIESMTDPATGINRYLYLIDTQIHTSYYPITNFGIGMMFEYMYSRSNYAFFPSFYSYGIYLRYYAGFKINKPILDRFKFFAEINFNNSNYKIEEKAVYPTVFDKPNQYFVKIPVGFQFQIWKGIHYETALEYAYFVGGVRAFYPRIGFEYHITKQKK